VAVRSTLGAIYAGNVDRAAGFALCVTLPSPPRQLGLPLNAPLKFAGPCVNPPR
jgi:hypothetical protein